ncbi:MAG TPA: tRNA (adenosine(37)-N6)-dimethylallyltransferase MiaA [Acidimicrobiales bacterium]|nr:tRNA (adenosine(37)-N6)-dimethylallyltransferase MiaA [Acidimicrobiales bacterium]
MSSQRADGGPHLVLVGPTASGKSALALEVARRLPGPPVELVSVDSMQVYRGMDVGTAKPTAEEQAEVPHHLIDLAYPSADFSVADFQAAAHDTLAAIESRGHRALLVGGTGLYLRAVIDGLEMPGRWPEVRAELEAEPDTAGLHRRLAGLDPTAGERMTPSNRRRIVRALEVTIGSGRPFSSFGPGLEAHSPAPRFRMAGVWLPRAALAERIEARVQAMLDGGLVKEVRSLATHAGTGQGGPAPTEHAAAGAEGSPATERSGTLNLPATERNGTLIPPPIGPATATAAGVTSPGGLSRTARQALGYREMLAHLAGECTLEEAIEETVRRTKAFARRQRMWFRRDPRITWYGTGSDPFALLPALLGDWSHP